MTRLLTLRRAESAKSSWATSRLLLALLLASFQTTDLHAEAPDPGLPAPERRTGPVVVTATRAERSVMEVAGNVTVLEREDIEASGARTVPELLRREAGLFVTSIATSPVGTRVEARGFNNGGSSGSSLLVLQDGRRVNEPDSADTDWALVPLDDIERIEIVRGPASALYGDNAVGGVINLVTRRRGAPASATLRGAGGSWSSGDGSLSASGSVGPVAGSFFVGGQSTDGYRDRSDFRALNLQGNVEVEIGERLVVGLEGGWHEDERNFPGALNDSQLAGLGRRAASPRSLTDRGDVRRGFLQGWLEAQLHETVLLRIQPHLLGRQDDVVITSSNPAFGTTNIDFKKGSVGIDAQLEIDRSVVSRRNRLILGTTLLGDNTDRDILSAFGVLTSRNERSVYGFFLQNELNLTPDLLLSGGVRFDRAVYELNADDGFFSDRVEPDFNALSPKAALTYRVFEPLAVYFSYAQGFRLPNFDENAPLLGDPNQRAFPDLRVQESESYEIGARLDTDRARGTLALYHMRVEDELIFDPTAGPFGFGENVNFDRVRHRGLELSLAIPVLSCLELYGSYTLEDVETQRYAANPAFVGKRLPINPLHRGTLGASADLPGGFEGLVNANLVGERHVSNDFDNTLPKLDPYAVVDLFLRWHPPLERLIGESAEHVQAVLGFGIRNLNDERYVDFAAFSPFTGTGFYPAPTRSFEGSLRIEITR